MRLKRITLDYVNVTDAELASALDMSVPTLLERLKSEKVDDLIFAATEPGEVINALFAEIDDCDVDVEETH
jgi:hypothetical protein